MTDMVYRWISVDEELPPKDGQYEVTNAPDQSNNIGVCVYDGIGFLWEGIYRTPKWWRFRNPVVKRYGKVKKE